MSDETTTEQLAEIDRDMADIERQVAELVEEAQQADYPQSQLQPVPVQVREGRWRTRNGLVKDVTAMPTNHEDFAAAYPWWDGVSTWRNDGRWLAGGSTMDLLEYLGPIEPDKTQELPTKTQEPQAAAIEELRSEVSYVQNLLGTERRRVTQLEELVASLRTINEAQEKAFEAATQDNTALRNQLEAVKAELVQERLERNRWHNQVLRVTAELDDKTTQCDSLQIELDAAQQVPADSPELRQLRADLAEVTQERDTYRDGYDRVLSDLRTIRETTKAETVEAIAEWLQAFRGCNSPALALLLQEALPAIMRSLTGLEDEEIE